MSTNPEAALPTQRIPVRVFLNYASEDRERAVWLHDRLIEAGLLQVWLDRAEIEGGERWKKEIDNGLRGSTVLLALLTKCSVDPSRQWVEYEQREARRLLKPIIPLRFAVDPPELLKHLQYVDFADDMNVAILALLSAIGKYTLRYTARTTLPGEPPPLLDAFIGRDIELQELFELIDSPSTRVETARQSIAIQGMGGQGKTMLTEELVRRIVARYPGGLILERRGQSPEPARAVLQKWATLALGHAPAREYQAADVRSLLAGYGELLVLIDDVSESDFEETKLLLEALPPDATRLLTTRSLNIASELGCLMYPLARLNDHDARELVRERLLGRMGATAAPADSPIQDEAIQRLVDLVQGHALALELASARCDFPEDLSDVVDQLATSLAEGLDDVAVDLARAVTKDNSLVVSLNISLDQLRDHDREQTTTWAERFAALGVFPDSGRMNRALIAAVWGDAGEDDRRTADALSGLYRRAMIKREPESKLYLAHPLLRAFARSLLRKEPDRLAATQLRYREFLIRTAGQGFSEPEDQWAHMELYTPHLLHNAAELWDECTLLLGDLNALAQLEAPAAGATLANPAAHDAVLRAVYFAQAVMPYVLRRPALGEAGRRILVLGLACVRAAGAEELLDTFVRALGVWYARSDPHAAEHYFEQALRWAEQTGDRAEQGKVLSDYGELQRNRSKLDHAVELLDRALAIHRELGDLHMQAATLKSLGEASWRRCDFDIATEHYGRALELYRGLADRSGEADLLNKVGSVEFNRGDYKKAISSFRKALPMHRELGNRSMEGEDLNDMGISCNYLLRPKRALPLLAEAIEIHSQLGNRRLEAIATANRAAALYTLGRQETGAYEKAVLEARRARAVARDIECRFTEVWAINWEALADQELGRPELALPLLEQAIALLEETAGGPRERVGTWGNLGYLLCKHLGQRERGAALLVQATELMRENVFTRAFGGRTLADLEALVREFSVESGTPK
jgi:tetratricopeptide (TPR) repeat protein